MTTVGAMPKWRAWLFAIRPRTLPAAVAPVLVGSALAWSDGAFSAVPALAATLVSLLLQIAANLANDYYDFVNGIDRTDRRGPQRAAQSGWIPLDRLRLGIGIVMAAAAGVGAYLVTVGGWPILVLGAAALLCSVAYSAGPFPLGYHGLGDLFVFVFFGVVAVSGTYFVQTLRLSPAALSCGAAVGSLTTAILVVNNLRDLDTDTESGKRTLAVILGPRATRAEYGLLMTLAYLIPLFLTLAKWLPPWTLLSWLTLPLALRLVRSLYSTGEGAVFNRLLAQTASLDLGFSALLAVGIVL